MELWIVAAMQKLFLEKDTSVERVKPISIGGFFCQQGQKLLLEKALSFVWYNSSC